VLGSAMRNFTRFGAGLGPRFPTPPADRGAAGPGSR
jgi:hypothetical protein